MYLQSNLKYFAEYNKDLISEINQVSTDDLEYISVKGTSVFKLADAEGNEFYSASIYDPDYEAEVFLRDVNLDNSGFFVLGINSASLLRKLLERKTETSWLFVIEENIRIVKKFLEEVDLEPYLEGKPQRLVFLYGERDKVTIQLQVYTQSLIGLYLMVPEFLRTFPTMKVNKDYYESISATIMDFIRLNMYNMGNDLGDTLLGISNEFTNLKYVLTRPRLKDLKNRFLNKTIICVASGPSLDKQLELLREAKGKCVIICAESAFKVLLRNNIVPDIVCILERGINSFTLSVDGIDIPEDTALFGLTIIEPQIYQAWHKYTVPCFKDNLSNSRFMNKSLGDLGAFYSGTSVAHMNYALACYLGGDPVVFIGQDLAYSEEGSTHSKYSLYNYYNDDGSDFDPVIKMQIKSALEDKEALHNAPVLLDGYYGGKVKSRQLWQQFLLWMEHHIEQFGIYTINATEGGADIKGTIKMPFREVVEKYCRETVDKVTAVLDEIGSDYDDQEIKIKSLIKNIDNLKKEADDLIDSAEVSLELTNDILSDIEKKTGKWEFRAARTLQEGEIVIRTILSNELMRFYLDPIIAKYHVNINPIFRITSAERLKEILLHQQYFLDAVVKGMKKLLKIFDDGIGRVTADLGLSHILDEIMEENDE